MNKIGTTASMNCRNIANDLIAIYELINTEITQLRV